MNKFSIWGTHAYHMELDLLQPGFVIFANETALMTTNGLAHSTLIGGPPGNQEGNQLEARFAKIKDFTQLNQSLIFVADFQNRCLWKVTRHPIRASHFFGDCREGDIQMLVQSVIRHWYQSSSVLVLGYDSIWIIDVANNTSRSEIPILGYNLIEKGPLTNLVYNKYSPELYLYGVFKVVKLVERGLVSILTGGSGGYMDGALDQALFRYPRSMLFVSQHILLVIDGRPYARLRSIDFEKKIVSTVCDDNALTTTKIGSIPHCGVYGLASLLLRNDVLYIGGSERIVSVSSKFDHIIRSPFQSHTSLNELIIDKN